MIDLLASVRPDSWNFPLFLHVFGAMVLVGAVTAAVVAQLWTVTPAGGDRLRRFSLLHAALRGDPIMVRHGRRSRVDLLEGVRRRERRPDVDRHRLRDARGRRPPAPDRHDLCGDRVAQVEERPRARVGNHRRDRARTAGSSRSGRCPPSRPSRHARARRRRTPTAPNRTSRASSTAVSTSRRAASACADRVVERPAEDARGDQRERDRRRPELVRDGDRPRVAGARALRCGRRGRPRRARPCGSPSGRGAARRSSPPRPRPATRLRTAMRAARGTRRGSPARPSGGSRRPPRRRRAATSSPR